MIQWGTEDTPGQVINYMQNQPWTDPEAYRSGSPLYNMHKVKTPTELIVYPDEGHGLTTYTHRKAKMKWDLAWFDRHLQTPEKKENVEAPTN